MCAFAIRSVMVLVLSCGLIACSSQQLSDYAEKKPVLDVQQFFDQRLKVYGVVKNRQSEVIRTFTADIKASWKHPTTLSGHAQDTLSGHAQEAALSGGTLSGHTQEEHIQSIDNVEGQALDISGDIPRQAAEGLLDETFYFDDGEVQHRQWRLVEQADGSYIATANDVIGEHRMQTAGNALFMEYVLRIPYKDGTIDVKVDDKMFLVSEQRIINESVFYKWGFKVGSVQLVIEKFD